MASFHFSVKSGKRGKASEHAAYIAREGKHGKNKDNNDLIAKEHGNLPEWANDTPSLFWKTADKNERINGAAYLEFEIALPSELTASQNMELVQAFIKQEIGNKPFQLAIHSPQASLGEVHQPHLHAMFSDRKPDGIERPPEQHFKRHNSAHQELGGCKKDSGGKDPSTLKNHLKTLRANWAELQNQFLEKNGHSARVDHRSNKERGIELEPERHLGHVSIKKMTAEDKAQIKDRRQSKQTSAQTKTDLSSQTNLPG